MYMKILKQKPLPFSFLVLFCLLAIHFMSSYFSWYWTFPWLDMLVHILSGLWVALVVLWVASVFNQVNSLKEYRIKVFLVSLVAATLFGVIWELIENFGQFISVGAPSYSWNTATDILGDIVGGIMASVYFTWSKIKIDKTGEILHPLYNQIGLLKN